MSDPRPQSVPMSQFLTVPLGNVSFSLLLTVADYKTCAEIRRNIYRILLLNPSETYLSTQWDQENDYNVSRNEMFDGIGYDDNFFEHIYNNVEKDAAYYLAMDQAFQETITEAPWVKKSVWKYPASDA